MSMPETDENRAHYLLPSSLADEVDYSLRDNAWFLGFVSRLELRMLGQGSCKGLSKRVCREERRPQCYVKH
jgi:hypothetical protein